ncbi:hypothetical protein JTE90_006361 [Oedothorax gibbosus]|uniref:Major facilitator superfamily (MFS) profile domain-containing protein n=1 Tax=Oedothorax gibbosus TaxID=931172 RepID=A0AAV6VW46_9ARAC|nr:hypothetical protein JTE90_006361 [Oedothorax gibbosus]
MEANRKKRAYSCCGIGDCQVRYILSILAFWSLLNLYMLRVNLSIALVDMVQTPKQATKGELCPNPKNSTQAEGGGQFNWSAAMQGHLLSAFFYGYLFTPLLAGAMASVYGALWVLGLGVLSAGIFTLLAPIAAQYGGPWALFAVRVGVGMVSGMGFPSVHALIGKWYPVSERSFQTTLIYNGVQAGTIAILVSSGFFIKSKFLGGWPASFYVSGLSSCIWFVFWAALVYESPDHHPWIGEEELETITVGEVGPKKSGKVPFREIAKSVPFYALCYTHFANNFVSYIQFTYVPTYFKQVLHLDIIVNGALSALPHLAFMLFSSPSAYLVDRMRSAEVLPINTLRKVANSMAFFVPALCLAAVPFIGCHAWPIIVLFTCSMGFNGLKLSGFEVTHIDMSPEFAGILMAGTNTVANLGGMGGPSFAGSILEAYTSDMSWKIIFVTTALVYVSGGIVFIVFGSADLQPWGISPGTTQVYNASPTPETIKKEESPEKKSE